MASLHVTMGFLLLTLSTCHLTRRIIGGQPIVHGSRHPGDVSLRHKGVAMSTHLCGGVVVQPRWILTAAHCVAGRFPQDLEVLIAKTDRRSVAGIIRGNYSKHTGENDIALLRIDRTVVVDVARLPSTEYQASGICTVVGYGVTSVSDDTLPDNLHSADVHVVPRASCQLDVGRYMTLASDWLCAGGDLVDACLGDSGSPLMCLQGEDMEVVVAGIVSAGFYGCATPGVPGVYTNVAEHRTWINRAMRGAGTVKSSL